MLASQGPLLGAVVSAINSSIGGQSQLTQAGVKITQVNMVMPDGRSVTLQWDALAGKPDSDTGNIPGDWVVIATA